MSRDIPQLTKMFQWAISHTPAQENEHKQIEGAEANKEKENAPTTFQSPQSLDPELVEMILGGPSDADLMKAAVELILTPDADLDSKETAFENLEMLLQQIDNANNLVPLNLWPELFKLLDSEEAIIRSYAVLCMSTAVQNNDKGQKELLDREGIPRIVQLAISDENKLVRKRSIMALSSAVRNCPPALEAVLGKMPEKYLPATESKFEATDMDSMDSLIHHLRKELL